MGVDYIALNKSPPWVCSGIDVALSPASNSGCTTLQYYPTTSNSNSSRNVSELGIVDYNRSRKAAVTWFRGPDKDRGISDDGVNDRLSPSSLRCG